MTLHGFALGSRDLVGGEGLPQIGEGAIDPVVVLAYGLVVTDRVIRDVLSARPTDLRPSTHKVESQLHGDHSSDR